MDTWATSSLTPQIAGGWGEDPDLFARVFPMDLRPQAHDIIRTWLFSTVLRAHLEHDSLPWAKRRDLRLGARPRPQEDVEVQGQRRHADGAARGARLRRRALLGGERPARHRHGLRRGPDEGRPAAGDQAPERVEVRARRRPSRRAPITRAARPRDAAPPRGARRRRRPQASRTTTTRARWSASRRSSGGSATTTSSWSRAAATANRARTGAASANRALRRGAVGAPAPVRAVPAVRDRGSVVVVAGRLRPPRALAVAPRSWATLVGDSARRPRPTSARYEWATDVLFEVRKQRSEAKQPLKVPIARVDVRAEEAAVEAMPSSRRTSKSALRVRAFESTVGEPREIRVSRLRAGRPVGASPVIAPLDPGRLPRHRAPGARGGSCGASATSTTDGPVDGRGSAARGVFLAKAPLHRRRAADVAFEAFRLLEPAVEAAACVREGERVLRRASRSPRSTGTARALLVGERTALNFLQRLSGIATLRARVRRRGRAAGSSSSTRARRRRRCARSRSTRCARAARRTIAPGSTTPC